jgi:hypothetical protein
MPLSNCEFTENRCSENHTTLTSVTKFCHIFKIYWIRIKFGTSHVHQDVLGNCNFRWKSAQWKPYFEDVNQFLSLFSTLTIRPELKFYIGDLNIMLLGICQFLNIGAGSSRTILMRVIKFTSTWAWQFESKGRPGARVLRHGEHDLYSC